MHWLAACLAGVGILSAALAAGAPSPGSPTADGSIFVNLRIQKRELYVGESVPVTIQVGAQDDVVASLDSPPTLRGDAFMLNVLSDQPEREQRVIHGKPCTLLAWHSVLAAVKPGTLPLAIEASLTVRVPVAPHRETTYADELETDSFSDPAFQTLLQTTTAQATVASSEPISLHVLALPTENRPADFSGAVGHFTIASELSSARTLVGEPVTLRLHVSGAGNFDRVDSVMLGDAPDWKMYRPTATFTAAESSGYQGEKLFEQAVVATQPGLRRLPALEFSYFNPDTHRYEIARAMPLSIEVGPPPPTAAHAAQHASPVEVAGAAATPKVGILVRNHPRGPGRTADSLIPLYLQARFLIAPAMLLVAFAGVWFKRVHRDQAAGDRARAGPREPSIDECMARMERAAATGNSTEFFRSAGRALRATGAAGHDAEARDILLLAEEAEYAGETPHGVDLQHCRRIVLRCLSTNAARADESDRLRASCPARPAAG